MAVNGANQERFLGALLGMAIGDALGMPVSGWSAGRIGERFGTIDDYHRRVFPDGAEIKAGEFTDESEVALCIVESFTANQGTLDPDNIGARLAFLAVGESKRWMGDETRAALERASESLVYRVALDEDGPATGDVAARGIPIGLIHAVGAFRSGELSGRCRAGHATDARQPARDRGDDRGGLRRPTRRPRRGSGRRLGAGDGRVRGRGRGGGAPGRGDKVVRRR